MTLRQRIWIDGCIQGMLAGRIVIYWAATVLYFGMGIAVTQYCDHPQWNYGEHLNAWFGKVSPWAPSACLILPLVIYDIVRTSHAFVGPIVRIKQQLAKLAQNPNCTPLVLRSDDYLQEITGPINNLQQQILSLHIALQKQRELIDELRSGSLQPASEPESDSSNLAQLSKAELETAQAMESMTSAS